MTLAELEVALKKCRLVASVQASPNSPTDDPQVLLKLAQASISLGVGVLRLQGAENIRVIKSGTGLPVIGLIKRSEPSSDVYITPTSKEVDTLLQLGCEVIALDGTDRSRPGGDLFSDLVRRIHQAQRLVMADCDSMESALFALESGADLIGTTLAGYTADRHRTPGPDLQLLRDLAALGKPVIAEGRYSDRWQIESALRIGATAVVVGGALNDPVKQTASLLPRESQALRIGAVDIGGTWLRFGQFDEKWRLLESTRTPNPPARKDRLDWIRAQIDKTKVEILGVSTGGVVDPATGVCWDAKEYLMPDQIGIEFSQRTLGIPTSAHGDGHATAWAHACVPQWAGLRVATLALGTGVGCGFVQEGRIWSGSRGEYPRINDLPTSSGETYERLLGGMNLSSTPTSEQQAVAVRALSDASFAIRNLYFPDVLVVAGSVGLSSWMQPELAKLGIVPSPFGTDAGLYGAAALALYPPN